MNVISKRGLTQLLKGKSDEVSAELLRWYKVARAARWTNLQEVREIFPDADQVGSVLVFNVRHNRYRLIVTTMFSRQRLFIKALLNHKEYDREDWKKWV